MMLAFQKVTKSLASLMYVIMCMTKRMVFNEKIRGKQNLWIPGVLLRCLKIYTSDSFIGEKTESTLLARNGSLTSFV